MKPTAFAVALFLCFAQTGGAATVDRKAWLADYAELKQGLELGYGHLAWFGSPEGGVDLPALDRKTVAALKAAHDDFEAVAALGAFVAAFHDGHLSKGGIAATTPSVEPPWPPSTGDAPTACASYGYQPSTAVQFSLPIETLAGFTLLNDGWRDAFRAGVLDVDGRRIGIVRIPRFRTSEYPALCEHVHRALAGGATPTRELVAARINTEFLLTLQKRLAQVKAAGAVALIVDVGGNGGGNDLGDWSTRLFSARALRSPSMWLASGAPAQSYFDVQLKDLRAAARVTPPLSAAS